MNHEKLAAVLGFFLILTFISGGCNQDVDPNILSAGKPPMIEPDYSDVTIPCNIAPMNFSILEPGENYIITCAASDGTKEVIKSSDGNVRFPLKAWKRVLGHSKGGIIKIEIISEDGKGKLLRYDPLMMKVVDAPIDPWLCYRLLYPGYESWVEMQIILRSTENFTEKSLIENQLLDGSCVNCHSFNKNSPDRFLVHVRGSKGGTYFFNGKELIRRSLRTENMTANAVYPAWHPSGKYVAFSSNKTVQSFHMKTGKNIEVTDMYSSLVIYDIEKNGMFDTKDRDTVKYMETFPCWSPNGDYLYYCRTRQVKEGYDFKSVKYDLIRKQFNHDTREFGTAEVVFKASDTDKSVSFPSVSPDGKYLIFTLHNYGTFSIWHKEADLYLLDLQTMKCDMMNINSEETESYHTWSSSGKWIVFSSKRMDGLTARSYFAYFGSSDSVGKPFVLPQKDPVLYRRLAKTFNRPELITGKPEATPRDFMEASKKEPLKAKWIGN
jgi:WD40 repeat protein